MRKAILIFCLLIFLISCYISTPIEDIYNGLVSIKSTAHSKYVAKVEIDDSDSFSDFYITTDGSNPSKSSDKYESYQDTIELFNGTELKVILEEIGEGYVFSYTVPGNLDGMISISAEYYSPSQHKVTIKCNEGDVYFHYTIDGTTPDKTDEYLYSYSGYASSLTKTIYVDNGATVSVRGRIKESLSPDIYSPVVTYVVPYFGSAPSINTDISGSKCSINIECQTAGAAIYYTLDGTEPDINSKMYLGSFNIEEGATVKAKAYREGCWSDTSSYTHLTTKSEPTILSSYYSSTSEKITISCPTSGVVIYYTTDGSEPDINDMVYSDAFTVVEGTTVKARVYKDGYWSNTSSYTFITADCRPSIIGSYCTYYSKMISISCPVENAVIYYTMSRQIPSVNDSIYTEPFEAIQGNIITARAYINGEWTDHSSYNVVTYVDTPLITTMNNSYAYKDINISCLTENVEIYYTIDGTIPDLNDKKYTGSFSVYDGTTVIARAYKEGYWSDTVSCFVLTNRSTPSITSSYYSPSLKEISISSPTDGVSIYYSTDGTEPDITDSVYSGPFTASEGTTIKARAYKNGYWSACASYAVPITVATPSIVSSKYSSSYAEIAINCETEGATIYYTLNGSEPNSKSSIYTKMFTAGNRTTIKAKAYKDGYWSETSSYEALTYASSPTIIGSYYSETSKEISLTCSTEGATIYYTTDGSIPDFYDNKYTNPIVIPNGTTLKVRAYRGGFWSSTVTETVSTVVDVPTVTTSHFSPDFMKLTLGCSTSGATIYYTTDGSTPDINDNEYSSSFTASDGTTFTIRAYKDGYWSDSVEYQVLTSIDTPFIKKTFSGISFDQISISCTTKDAVLYYTIDGTTPDLDDFIYNGEFKIYEGQTLNARAYRDGYWSSTTTYYVETVKTPRIVRYEDLGIMAIFCSTDDAEIYYTTDGTLPDFNDNVYTRSFGIPDESTIIKARAYKDGKWSLCISTIEYSVPSIGPAGGYIFYDCDADNETGNADGLISSECGWRYLEAAPDDLGSHIYGPRRGYLGSTDIGRGKANTESLVKLFGEGDYAAKVCFDYELTANGEVFTDWFLPSLGELYPMYRNLHKSGLGAFTGRYYWSSSGSDNHVDYVRNLDFYYGTQDSYTYNYKWMVRPIRAFQSDYAYSQN